MMQNKMLSFKVGLWMWLQQGCHDNHNTNINGTKIDFQIGISMYIAFPSEF